MRKYLVIDGGTTNTRLHYTEEGKVLETVKLKIGVRSTLEQPGLYQQQIRESIEMLFERYGRTECILASGMISSEMGLFCLPHLPTPAGVAELHNGMKKVNLPEISDVPFYFIPGLKMISDDFRKCDMMRGEECEIMGLARETDGDCVYVLSGSHSKLITMENGKVTAIFTMLTGEMTAALSDGTILKSSVDLNQPLNEDYLCMGCEYAAEEGINAALFKTRVLDTVNKAEADKIYSFFLGAVLSGEIASLKKEKANRILLAGQKQLAGAAAMILRKVSDKEVILSEEFRSAMANVIGMIRIYEYQ